jgi:sensor histidine kinase YesM
MLFDFHSEIYSWIRGGLFVLFIYNFIFFFQNRSKLYLYYSLYLLGLTLFLLQHVVSPEIKEIYYYLNFPIQFLTYAASIAFGREILDTRNRIVKWDRFSAFAINILLVLAGIFFLIQLLFGYSFQVKAFTIFAPILTISTLIAFYIIITRLKDNFSLYYVAGTLLFVLFANISFLELNFGTELLKGTDIHPIFFMYLGAILQCIIFSVLIGITIRRTEQKSINAEIRLAVKLKEMEELKMVALQSQMNPHFLFNSLNSINNFVLKNDIEKASDYLTKFSKLIRVILNSSSSSTSSLSEELEILSLYIKLEQMRVTGGFNYIVDVDDSIRLNFVKVPPLFLQPFIENSIWHGIMKKEGEKTIKLTIKEEKNNIVFRVHDNGIGINKAKGQNHMSQKKRFYGAEATGNRIKILYKNKDVLIETKDISSGKNTGTEVTISFPLIYG